MIFVQLPVLVEDDGTRHEALVNVASIHSMTDVQDDQNGCVVIYGPHAKALIVELPVGAVMHLIRAAESEAKMKEQTL
jgi:hypothetical protein